MQFLPIVTVVLSFMAIWSSLGLAEPVVRPTAHQTQFVAQDLSSPQRAMDSFFAALNSFDARSYEAMLTEDATLFFTGPPFPIRRVQGRVEIMRLVAPLFEKAAAQGARGMVTPADIEFQTWGDTSIVTFHIPAGSALDRRTFVLRRFHGKWKIAHLHASVTRQGPAPPLKGG
jgi:ketosteroid isomerase-like protein